MSSDAVGTHATRERSNLIREMLAAEYQRVLGTMPPRYPSNRHSAQQLARARGLARRNILDRLQAADGTGPAQAA